MFFFALNDNERNEMRYIYERYNKVMLNIAYDVLKDKFKSQDIVQSSFEKISKILYRMEEWGEKKFIQYIYVIVRNKAIDRYKKRLKIVYLEPSDLNDIKNDSEIDIDVRLIQFENSVEMAANLDKINSRYSSIITLKYYMDLSNKEIADTIGLTEANVRVLLHRAKRTLKKLLEKEIS